MPLPLLAIGAVAAPIALSVFQSVTARGIVTAGSGFLAGSVLGGSEPEVSAAPVSAGVSYARYATIAVAVIGGVIAIKTIKEAIE